MFLKIWLLCFNFENFTSINLPMNLPWRSAVCSLMVGLFGWIFLSWCTTTKFSGITLFEIIIISVNFQLKQFRAKFLPLTVSYSCASISVYLLWWYLVKFFLKVKIDKIYHFIAVHVICVYDLTKKSSSLSGIYVCFGSHVESHISLYQVVHFQGCD